MQNLKIAERSVKLSIPSNSPEIILSAVRPLFDDLHTRNVLYRTAGVVLQDLMTNYTLQEDLFGGTRTAQKLDQVYRQIDALEDKFGKRVVYLGSTQQALKHKEKGTDADDVDRDLLFL